MKLSFGSLLKNSPNYHTYASKRTFYFSTIIKFVTHTLSSAT